jgi:hypothetical protein
VAEQANANGVVEKRKIKMVLIVKCVMVQVNVMNRHRLGIDVMVREK